MRESVWKRKPRRHTRRHSPEGTEANSKKAALRPMGRMGWITWRPDDKQDRAYPGRQTVRPIGITSLPPWLRAEAQGRGHYGHEDRSYDNRGDHRDSGWINERCEATWREQYGRDGHDRRPSYSQTAPLVMTPNSACPPIPAACSPVRHSRGYTGEPHRAEARHKEQITSCVF